MHPWNVSPEEAVALQRQLAPRVLEGQPVSLESVTTIAGVDASYAEGGRGVVVVFSFPALEILDTAESSLPSVFPYVPGLLSFREAPLILSAMQSLRVKPDLLLVDGQGYAHPRRLGLASHLGLYLDMPSIGAAKSRLVGSYEEPGPEPGDRSPLVHRRETIGMVLRTKAHTKPLFVSVGYRITLPDAVDVVLRSLRGYRLPEPTRIADKLTHTPAR